MTEEDICNFLKEAVKEEVKAASEYREWAEKMRKQAMPPSITGPLPEELSWSAHILEEIASDQENHAHDLANRKEALCPGDDPEPGSPDVEKAVEAFDGKGRKVLISLLRDGSLTICSRHDEKTEEGECYSMDPSPANRQIFYVAQAHYSGMGMKVRTLADD